MIEAVTNFFSTNGFMPHGHCYLWNPLLVWTMVTSDTFIGFAYVSISLSLYALVKKIKLPFSIIFVAFGLFIGACGATHFMEVWTLWVPLYWVAALLKVITATASVVTAVLMFPLAPRVVKMAEAAKQSELHREQLMTTNQELEVKSRELAATNLKLADQQKALTHSAKMSALGEMAGGIAHEINSPLGIITVRANQLQRLSSRNQLTPDMIVREANLIADTALRIGDIIKGLRAFAREGERDPFDSIPIKNVVSDALVLCKTKFKNYGVDLQVQEIPDDLRIECRSVQITQVLLNLLNNAFDAVVGEKNPWVKIRCANQEDKIVVSVIDSGNGIDEEVLPKIMQPFFTTKQIGKGTGLGLSISKGITESHRGTLEVDVTAPNTSFVLVLPKRQLEESE